MEIDIRTPEQIGEAIRRFRKKKGLTQKDICERTNLRIATISSLENGDGGTKLSTLMRVASVLELKFRVSSRDDAPSIEDIF
jgi:HTH-type transcriptional regulator/antitoxin HipB